MTYVFTMITMAAKSEFYENRTKIHFADITVLSSNEDITYYEETIEKVKQKTNKKKQGLFSRELPFKDKFVQLTLGRNSKNSISYLHLR